MANIEVRLVDQVDAQPFVRFGEADILQQLADALAAGHARLQFLPDRFELGPIGGLGGLAALVLGARCVAGDGDRSEEHTSELQSLMRSSYAVFCLKKKKQEIGGWQY